MRITELLLLAVGLSMDAFAAALCLGLRIKRAQHGWALTTALSFGGFQALMPLIGFFCGREFEQHVTLVAHWVAFCLLLILGGKMVYEAIRQEAGEALVTERIRIGEVLLLAIATSIDALVVGIMFAFLEIEIISAVSLIGVVTFVLSLAAVRIGTLFGARLMRKAEIIGGVILILIGAKMLVEYLG